jgi:hypothetical protein
VWTIFVADTALIAGDDARLNNFVESRGGPINC